MKGEEYDQYNYKSNIDERILKVCQNAENDYESSKSNARKDSESINELKNINNKDYDNNNNKLNDINLSVTNGDSQVSNILNDIQNKSYSKIGIINNRLLSQEKLNLSKNIYDKYNNNNYNSNNINNIKNGNNNFIRNSQNNHNNKPIIQSIYKDIVPLQSFNDKDNYSKTSLSLNGIKSNKNSKNKSISQQKYLLNDDMYNNINNINISKYNQTKLDNNLNSYKSSRISKYNQQKANPLYSVNNKRKFLTTSSNKMNPHLVNHEDKINIPLTILNAKSLIKSLKLKNAYVLLKSAISCGVYHSDIFYLFGEVNRLLGNHKNAEEFLLLSLNFELHSPYAFYSLGLLYQDLGQYETSNVFFKLFGRIIDKAELHFNIGQNLANIGKYLGAAEELTTAIKMDKTNEKFYKFRMEIYSVLGMEELRQQDEEFLKMLINMRKEDYL